MQHHLLLLALLCGTLPAAHAQHSHVHGAGKLDVVVAKDQLTLDLELPLDVALGFERAPKTDKEKAALAEARKTLEDAAALFAPSAAARCTVQTASVKLPDFDGGEHADIDASYRFRCAEPAALRSVETLLFKHFKRLYRLEVQRATPTGQGAARLTPKHPMLTW